MKVASAEARTAASLVRMYLTSLGRLEYQSGRIPDASASNSELKKAELVAISSSHVVGIAVARTELTQLG